jgi:hypothetical protein
MINGIDISAIQNRYKENGEYDGCNTCIHCNDSCDICKLRSCIHAFNRLYECYEKKPEKRNTGLLALGVTPDNRDAEAKDITDEYYRENKDSKNALFRYTVICPHCGHEIIASLALSNHYCYICGGKFGRRNLSADYEDEE